MKIIKQTKQLVSLILFAIILFSCSQNNELELNLEQKNSNLVNESLANEIANNFQFKSNSKSKSIAQKERKVKEVFPVKDENKETLFYIINYESEGFLILSADNRISPVLAYSENNEFRTNLKSYNSGLESWLSSIKKTIQAVRIKQTKQTQEIKLEWDNLILQINLCDEDILELVGPLLSTIWTQGSGYNTYMPTTRSCGMFDPVSVGCTPLAIAQVMKYHNYPTNYNWSDMPNNSGTNSTAILLKSIYDVIKDDDATRIGSSCTVGVYADYNIARLFRKNFDYSTAKRSNYDKEIVKQELRLNRPVILSALEAEGNYGHTWVCDGLMRKSTCYTTPSGIVIDSPFNYTSLFLHMKWGWGGASDGWYSANNFNPSGYDYNYEVEMVYKIKP